MFFRGYSIALLFIATKKHEHIVMTKVNMIHSIHVDNNHDLQEVCYMCMLGILMIMKIMKFFRLTRLPYVSTNAAEETVQ